jgi:hypothetical protein
VRGCLFTLALGAVALALLVVVGLPRLAAGLITGAVTAAGLEADDTTVTVSSDPPTDLLGLHADRVRIRATDAVFRGVEIGALDIALSDVAILDRTADAVAGRLSDVSLRNIGARRVALDTITLGGSADEVTASAVVAGTEAETLIADAVETGLGVRPDDVRVTAPDRVVVVVGGVRSRGRLLVTDAGDLVARMTDGPAEGRDLVLLRAGEDVPIRLQSIAVDDDGTVRLDGVLTVGLLG